jgi:hypothetical protein
MALTCRFALIWRQSKGKNVKKHPVLENAQFFYFFDFADLRGHFFYGSVYSFPFSCGSSLVSVGELGPCRQRQLNSHELGFEIGIAVVFAGPVDYFCII